MSAVIASETAGEPHVEYTTNAPYEIRIYNAKGIAAKLGDHTLAAFYRCFAGVDRLLTFHHLMYLNQQAEHHAKPEVRVDGFAHNRNLRMLVFLIAATLYELGDALQSLCDSKVALKVMDRSSWMPLNDLRAQWNKADYASTIRDNFAAHLGKIDAYRAGIEKSPDMVVLQQLDINTLHAGEIIEPGNALLRGLNIQDHDMKTFIESTHKAQDKLPGLLFAFFRDVLTDNGIPVVKA
jgi:hypothetical protein